MRCRFTTRPITRSRSYATGCLSRPILGMSTGLQSRDRSLHSAIGSRLARHHRVVTVETREHPWIDATAPPTVFGGAQQLLRKQVFPDRGNSTYQPRAGFQRAKVAAAKRSFALDSGRNGATRLSRQALETLHD